MSWKRRLNPWAVGAVALFVLLILFILTMNLCLRAFGFRAYTINSAAMAPMLRPGEHILVNANAYSSASPQRGDLVTFVRPDVAGEVVFVKRVVAVGGDTIEGEGDLVKLNGVILHEPYTAPINKSDEPPVPFGPVSVPAGKFFVMGDARRNSNDSRFFGCVDLKDIRGKVIYIVWSKNPSRNWTRVK